MALSEGLGILRFGFSKFLKIQSVEAVKFRDLGNSAILRSRISKLLLSIERCSRFVNISENSRIERVATTRRQLDFPII